MQAFQKALDGFWRDITGRERLEVFEDPAIPIFDLAVRLFAAILPPVLRQFREAGFFEGTIWKIPSFGNLCFALPQPLSSQLGVPLAGALPNDGASLLPWHRISIDEVARFWSSFRTTAHTGSVPWHPTDRWRGDRAAVPG